MKVGTADTCCCGCSLRFGTLLIGFLALILSLYLLAESIKNYHEIVQKDEITTELDNPDNGKMKEHIAHQITFYYDIVYPIILAVLSGILLFGVFIGNHNMVRTWAFGILTIVIFTIRGYLVHLQSLENFDHISFLVSELIHIYFAWIVYSYAQEMKRRSSFIIA